MESPPKVIAGVMGLAGFATASVAGLATGNEAGVVLGRAIAALLICSIIGALIGMVGRTAVAEHLASFRASNPPPDRPEVLRRIDEEQQPTTSPAAGAKT